MAIFNHMTSCFYVCLCVSVLAVTVTTCRQAFLLKQLIGWVTGELFAAVSQIKELCWIQHSNTIICVTADTFCLQNIVINVVSGHAEAASLWNIQSLRFACKPLWATWPSNVADHIQTNAKLQNRRKIPCMEHGSPTNAVYLPVTDYRHNLYTIVAPCILQALDFLCHVSFQLGIYSQKKKSDC